jgi:hypothetical protein
VSCSACCGAPSSSPIAAKAVMRWSCWPDGEPLFRPAAASFAPARCMRSCAILDFLDHGAEYLKHGKKDEAAVIAGIVFEDTIRRICRVLEIPEKGVALETLISELTKRDVLTALKAKRARAAAGLRTSAAHARWEEIQLSDVRPVIEFTRELMAAHLE